MTRIETLIKPLSAMTPEEIIEKIRAIRDDRKISKHAEKVQKTTRIKRTTKVQEIFASMSPEQQAAFLKEIGGI